MTDSRMRDEDGFLTEHDPEPGHPMGYRWPERQPCDCCDHPLQHAIREIIARYEAPIPPPSLGAVMRNLRAALADFEDGQ